MSMLPKAQIVYDKKIVITRTGKDTFSIEMEGIPNNFTDSLTVFDGDTLTVMLPPVLIESKCN